MPPEQHLEGRADLPIRTWPVRAQAGLPRVCPYPNTPAVTEGLGVLCEGRLANSSGASGLGEGHLSLVGKKGVGWLRYQGPLATLGCG